MKRRGHLNSHSGRLCPVVCKPSAVPVARRPVTYLVLFSALLGFASRAHLPEFLVFSRHRFSSAAIVCTRIALKTRSRRRKKEKERKKERKKESSIAALSVVAGILMRSCSSFDAAMSFDGVSIMT